MWEKIQNYLALRIFAYHKIIAAAAYLDEPNLSGSITHWSEWQTNRDATTLLMRRLPKALQLIVKFDRLYRWAPDWAQKEN